MWRKDYDHYRIHAVVGFRDSVFENALVDTVFLLIARCEDEHERLSTETNFVRISEPVAPETIIQAVDQTHSIPAGRAATVHHQSAYRTISVRQSHLAEHIERNMHHFINAPALYTAVFEHSKTVSLSAIATVSRGVKTGANPIFILDDEDIVAQNVEQRFLRPAIKSVKEIDGFEHTSTDVETWLLDMHDYVEQVTPREAADCVKQSLREDGYTGVCSYLEWAEGRPSRTNASLSSNNPWFDIGCLDDSTAPILCPQAMDTRRFFFRTDENIATSNRFLLIEPDKHDPSLLLGLLNSRLSKIVVESHGRVTGGGAINLSSSDLRTFQLVNPDGLTGEQTRTVVSAFERLAAGNGGELDSIDEVVIDVLGLDITVSTLQTIADRLKHIRRKKENQLPKTSARSNGRLNSHSKNRG